MDKASKDSSHIICYKYDKSGPFVYKYTESKNNALEK